MSKTFVDASVLVAILAMEADFTIQSERLAGVPEPFTSAIALWEAALAISRIRRVDVNAAYDELILVIDRRGVEIVPLGQPEAAGAVAAHAKYGKRNHTAKLNMGDCFAYACAKTNKATLLYKGDDFAQTDLA